MDRDERIRTIRRLCKESGCDEKISKIHFSQYVDRGWHPHPPREFTKWRETHNDYAQGVGFKVAYNCQRYRDEFTELKQYGAT